MRGSISFELLRRWVPVALALIVACGLLVACSSDNQETPDATEMSVPTDTPEVVATALSGPPRIGEAIWATSIDPHTAAPIVAGTPVVDDSAIYAVFPIIALPAGSQLVASWYFNDTTLDALDSAMRIDRDRDAGWVEFHIERTGADPWPDGVYEVVVTDGTTELQRAEVTIS